MLGIREHNKVRMLADPYLFTMFTLGVAVIVGADLWITSDVIHSYRSNRMDIQNSIGTLAVFAVITCVLFVAFFIARKQWANIITLTKTEIVFGPILGKKSSFPYDTYPLVYYGSFVQNAVGAPGFGPKINYIVLSQRKLSDDEKQGINEVKPPDVIKIKYSDKRYSQLAEILPPNLSSQLNAVFLAYRKPDDLALRRSAITAKARRRKKQKRK